MEHKGTAIEFWGFWPGRGTITVSKNDNRHIIVDSGNQRTKIARWCQLVRERDKEEQEKWAWG